MLNIYLNLEIIEDNLYKEIDNKNFAGKDSIRNKSHHISNKDCIEAEGKKHSGIRKLRKRIKNVSKKAMIEKKKRLAAQKEEFIKAGDILKKKINKAIAYRIGFFLKFGYNVVKKQHRFYQVGIESMLF